MRGVKGEDAFCERDRQFESPSLQRRVNSELGGHLAVFSRPTSLLAGTRIAESRLRSHPDPVGDAPRYRGMWRPAEVLTDLSGRSPDRPRRPSLALDPGQTVLDPGLRPGTPRHGEELEPLLDEEVRVHL